MNREDIIKEANKRLPGPCDYKKNTLEISVFGNIIPFQDQPKTIIYNIVKFKKERSSEGKFIWSCVSVTEMNREVLIKEKALDTPVVLWRFCAYKSQADYDKGKYYFKKDFLKHHKLKKFTAKHNKKEKSKHSGYISMYWKFEL